MKLVEAINWNRIQDEKDLEVWNRLECEWEGQRSDAVTTIINKEYVYYREDDKFPAFLRHENGDEEWVADFVKESLAKKFVKAANKDLK